ncbi:FIMAH domain-containing protein [Salicibibacter halophilus]|uniref:FIMAH domain-containing protein n=1 Tax=Salicibibacter halophilus TaxID=2502791 RepID=UPI001356C6FF|nr:M14 family zinc carboxypeptidase [Salicibibacter halophilus]
MLLILWPSNVIDAEDPEEELDYTDEYDTDYTDDFSDQFEFNIEDYDLSDWTNHEELGEELDRIEDESNGEVEVEVLGTSQNDRELYSARAGEGDRVLLIDSEIHGNEKSGTEAILSMLDTLGTDDSQEVELVLYELTIIAVPKLNPDGSEDSQRQNDISWEEVVENHPQLEDAEPAWYWNESANGFDVNRDFNPDLDYEPQPEDLPGTSADPGIFLSNEARILADLYQDLEAEFGEVEAYVNLHHMGTPQLEETGEDVTVALSYPPLGPEDNPKYDEWEDLDQDKSRRYTMAAANGMEEKADDDDYPVLARYINPDIFDLSGIALGAFGLNGSASILFEMAGQQPQTPYDEDLIEVVEDGLWGIANSMADGTVDDINGDDFYDIPKYWPDEPNVSEPGQYATDFTENAAGEAPEDWSPIWQGEEEQFTVLEDPNRLQHVAESGVRGLTSDEVGEIFGSAEMFGLVRGSNVQETLFELGFHMSGSSTNENMIYADAQIEDADSGESSIRIMERNGGSAEALASEELPFTLEEDEWYRVLLQRDADALRVKMWPNGQEEPEEWQAVEEQGSRYGGSVGISHATPGTVNEYAFIGVGIGGEEAPHAPDDILDPEDPGDAPAIENLQPTEDLSLSAGESVDIAFDSEPGLDASFSIRMPLVNTQSAPTELPMTETDDGHYVAYWTATSNVEAEGAEIEVAVTDEDGNENRETAEGRLDINVDEDSSEKDITIDNIRTMIEHSDETGEFASDEAFQALSTHLTAVNHYEQQNDAGKVVNHMEGFQDLLNDQQANEAISEKAFEDLQAQANAVIENWE